MKNFKTYEEFLNKFAPMAGSGNRDYNTEGIDESIVTEANPHAKPAGLTKDETMEVAQRFADAMSKADGKKVTVNKRTLEEDSFDLDVDGEEFDGGSYNIFQNGNVMNMALRNNPVYGKKNDSVDTIVNNMKKMSESVNESFENPLEAFPQVYKDLLKKLQRSNDRGERFMLINKMNVIRKKLKLKPLTTESVVNEAASAKNYIAKFEKLAKQYNLKEVKPRKEDGVIVIKSYLGKPAGVKIEFNIYHQEDISPSSPDFADELEVFFATGNGGSGNDSIHDWLDKKTWKRYFDTSTDESVVNEAKDVKSDVIDKLSQFFNVSTSALIKFKFDGKDDIRALTKALNGTDYEGVDNIVRVAILSVKRDLGIEESIVTEAARVPYNVLDFAKRKGSYATSLVKKAATWAEKAGKYISGGTAIGKDYMTIILDMKHQGSEIYINLNDETIELFGEEVTDAKSFQKVLDANMSESKVNEAKDKHDVLDSIENDIKKGNIQKFQITDEDVWYWASKIKAKLSDNDVDWILGNLDESVVTEGAMSELDIIAKEAKDFKSFVKEFKKEFKNMDAGSPKELEAWLQTIYDSAKESVYTQVPAKTIALTEGTDLGSWNQGGPKANKNVLITQYVGPKDIEDFGLGRKCIQINVGMDYVQLNPADIVELQDILKSYKVK